MCAVTVEFPAAAVEPPDDRREQRQSGALPNAPLPGHWFSARFQRLTADAYPPSS
ncbi:hypothetical protein ACWDE0_11370 [Streptomyces sp. 900105755]